MQKPDDLYEILSFFSIIVKNERPRGISLCRDHSLFIKLSFFFRPPPQIEARMKYALFEWLFFFLFRSLLLFLFILQSCNPGLYLSRRHGVQHCDEYLRILLENGNERLSRDSGGYASSAFDNECERNFFFQLMRWGALSRERASRDVWSIDFQKFWWTSSIL